ncbi:MAG: hypothetical protein ACT4OT_07665 [Acidobacteriota bacterium]
MKRPLSLVAFIALLGVLAAINFVLHTGVDAAKASRDVPVTSTIDGFGVDTLPTLRIQGDQLGAYRNASSLKSILQAALGDWELDLLNYTSSPQRKVLIDLRDPVPNSGPNGGAPTNPFGAAGYQLVRARFIAKCSQNGIDMRNMQMNTPYFCPLATAFNDAAGVRYRLANNPTNFSETNWVYITCVGINASAKCSQWRLEPSVTHNGELKIVSKLLKVATKPNQSDQDMGNFYLSFAIHLTNP